MRHRKHRMYAVYKQNPNGINERKMVMVENGKVVEGAQARQARLEREANQNKESTMGEITPSGLPDHIRSLVLTYDINNGNIQVAGAVGDKVLAYGMLMLAHDCIKDYHDKKIPNQNIT